MLNISNFNVNINIQYYNFDIQKLLVQYGAPYEHLNNANELKNFETSYGNRIRYKSFENITYDELHENNSYLAKWLVRDNRMNEQIENYLRINTNIAFELARYLNKITYVLSLRLKCLLNIKSSKICIDKLPNNLFQEICL